MLIFVTFSIFANEKKMEIRPSKCWGTPYPKIFKFGVFLLLYLNVICFWFIKKKLNSKQLHPSLSSYGILTAVGGGFL